MTSAGNPSPAPITDHVARHIVAQPTGTADSRVFDRAKMHILDTLVAVSSGSTLRPGRVAATYAELRRSLDGPSSVIGLGGQKTHPEVAALANGTAAHADETDDGSDLVRMHTGASVVPAALALAEAVDATGADLLDAVIVGYDVGVAMNLAVWQAGRPLRQSIQLTHGIGQLFGALAASVRLARLSLVETTYALSYASQHASGLTSAFRDSMHIEKAWSMGGKQAHDAVQAVNLIRSGFTGVTDILDTYPSLFDVWGTGGDRSRLPDLLDGSFGHIMACDLKVHPVGMPIQAAAQALSELITEHGLEASQVEAIQCHLPSEKAPIVDNPPIPDINCQYILAVMLEDGMLTFDAAHDYDRLARPETRAAMQTITVVHDEQLDAGDRNGPSTRRAVLELRLRDGRQLSRRVDPPRGNSRDPMTWKDLASKSRAILGSIVPGARIDELVDTVQHIEDLPSASDLISLVLPYRPDGHVKGQGEITTAI